MAVVESKLLTNIPSRIKFRVNDKTNICISLCCRNVVKQQGFLVTVNALTLFDTQYCTTLATAPTCSATVALHSNYRERGSWKLKKGDIIAVELDPLTGKLTNSKAGRPPVVLGSQTKQ